MCDYVHSFCCFHPCGGLGHRCAGAYLLILLRIQHHLHLIEGGEEGLDFVEVTEAVVLGAAFDVEGDYRIAEAMDPLHLAVGFLGVDVAVGDAHLQELFRQGDAL